MFEIDRQQAKEYESVMESWEQLKQAIHSVAAMAQSELDKYEPGKAYDEKTLQRMNQCAAIDALYVFACKMGMFADDEGEARH